MLVGKQGFKYDSKYFQQGTQKINSSTNIFGIENSPQSTFEVDAMK